MRQKSARMETKLLKHRWVEGELGAAKRNHVAICQCLETGSDVALCLIKTQRPQGGYSSPGRGYHSTGATQGLKQNKNSVVARSLFVNGAVPVLKQ